MLKWNPFYIPKMECPIGYSSWTCGGGCFTAAIGIDKLYLLIGLYINVSLQHVLNLFTWITHICITCVICVLKLLVVSFRPFFTLYIYIFIWCHVSIEMPFCNSTVRYFWAVFHPCDLTPPPPPPHLNLLILLRRRLVHPKCNLLCDQIRKHWVYDRGDKFWSLTFVGHVLQINRKACTATEEMYENLNWPFLSFLFLFLAEFCLCD